MIDIVRYREELAELRERVNEVSELQIDGVVVAVHEGHMQKKLKDKEGIYLCGNYPDAEMTGADDNHQDNNRVLLFLLEKIGAGSQTDEEELQHYARMQRLMKCVKDELLDSRLVCGGLDAQADIRTEWEYGIFGGFNGLSIGLTVKDYD